MLLMVVWDGNSLGSVWLGKCTSEGELGLQLNRTKCEIVFQNDDNKIDDPSFYCFKHTPLGEATLLGSPLMPGPAVDKVVSKKADDLERTVGRLSMLHSHDALILLRNGLSVPKLLYTFPKPCCFNS